MQSEQQQEEREDVAPVVDMDLTSIASSDADSSSMAASSQQGQLQLLDDDASQETLLDMSTASQRSDDVR